MKLNALPYSAVYLPNASFLYSFNFYSKFVIIVLLFIFTVPLKVIAHVRYIVQSTGQLIS